MKLSKKLTSITPLSKLAAMAFFILLPFLGFYLGTKYQELNYTTAKTSQNQNQITQKQAEDIVRNLPEVKEFLKMVTDNKSKWFVSAAEDEENTWSVQVAEVIENLKEKDEELRGHTNTFNWYRVDKNTGIIVWSMFNFDSQGDLIKTQ